MSDSIAEYTADTAVTRRPHPRIARPRETANNYEEKSAKNTQQVNGQQSQSQKVDKETVSDQPKQKGKQPKRKSKKGKKAKQGESKKQLKEDESTDDETNSSADEKHHKKGVWQSFKKLFSRNKKNKGRKQQAADDKVKEDLSRECSCSCSTKTAEECKDQSNVNMDNPQIGTDQPKIRKKKPLKSIEKDQDPKMLRRFRYTSDGILPQKVLPTVDNEDYMIEATKRQQCFVSYIHEESEDTDDSQLQWEGLYDNTPAVQESKKIVRFAKPPLIIPSCTPTESPAFLSWAQAGRMHMRDMGRMDGQTTPMTAKMLRKSRYTSEGILPSTSRLGRVRRVQLH